MSKQIEKKNVKILRKNFHIFFHISSYCGPCVRTEYKIIYVLYNMSHNYMTHIIWAIYVTAVKFIPSSKNFASLISFPSIFKGFFNGSLFEGRLFTCINCNFDIFHFFFRVVCYRNYGCNFVANFHSFRRNLNLGKLKRISKRNDKFTKKDICRLSQGPKIMLPKIKKIRFSTPKMSTHEFVKRAFLGLR